jgi:heme exporter protein C
MRERGALRSNVLLGLSFILMVAALYLIFIYVPTEEGMGIVQRIFYFHVPVAWTSFLAFFIVFVGSILYLWKKGSKWDILAYSSAELGVVFTTLALITGSIWARPVWGVWWTWDPRLTTTLVLWLVYLGYLMVRSFATEESRGVRFAAVVGIVGFINVPLVFLTTRLWRAHHPETVIFAGGLAPSMLLTLIVCLAAFTILYIHLLMRRISLRQMETEIQKLR